MHTQKFKMSEKQVNMISRARNKNQAIRRFWVAYKQALSDGSASIEHVNESFEKFVDSLED